MNHLLNERICRPGHVAQLVASPTADPGIASSTPVPYLVEIDHKVISTFILLLPLIQEGLFVSYKGKYVHKVLVNSLVKLAQEKVWLGELTIMTSP